MSSFEEKELEILRKAVDIAEKRQQKRVINSPDVLKIIEILENYLKEGARRICYGGTAINNILPYEYQFYDKSIELPDYDFYSMNAMNCARELSDLYYKAGFTEVEAKSGIHRGTYKVFVNQLAVADITHLDKDIFHVVQREAVVVDGIYYAPPNFLRMAMYLELSRPEGDVSRWEKVLKRLILLNKHFPLKQHNCKPYKSGKIINKITHENHRIVNSALIDRGVVFFGGYANSLYTRYLPKKFREGSQIVPDFDVLAEDPEKVAVYVKERLESEGKTAVSVVPHEAVGELIPKHYEIKIGKERVAFIYQPVACHSYNVHRIMGRNLRIATIDTMLNMYLAFLYSNRPYYNASHILCMAQNLFRVQQKNRLKQKGLLKRFSVTCYGPIQSLEQIRSEKAAKFNELKDNKNSLEYQRLFFKYVPGDCTNKKTKKQTKTRKQKQPKKKVKSKTRKFGFINFV